MRPLHGRQPSGVIRLALLALAFVTGSEAGRALAERDRPLPRRLAPVPTAARATAAAGLARAVFGVG